MVHGKLFAAISKGRLLVKLPKDEVAKLIAEKRGAPFSSGGRIMKEWATIVVEDQDAWLDIAQRAREFVGEQSSGVPPNARSRRR
jgi:TfoX/Sxy family transcriptional regulator of competence genes